MLFEVGHEGGSAGADGGGVGAGDFVGAASLLVDVGGGVFVAFFANPCAQHLKQVPGAPSVFGVVGRMRHGFLQNARGAVELPIRGRLLE